MTTRRNFLRKAALGSAAISSTGAFTVLQASPASSNPDRIENRASEINIHEKLFPGWESSFEESGSVLLLRNGSVAIHGEVGFVSGNSRWSVTKSRDGVPDRFALVDLQDNVQGYFVLHTNGEQLQLLFYHRTAQSYQGLLSFKGKISFLSDSFPCITRAKADERVLSLSCGPTDSLLNDSLFAPESDTSLRLDAAILHIDTQGGGSYSFTMSGHIGESSEAVFTINLESNYFKNRYIPYYHSQYNYPSLA